MPRFRMRDPVRTAKVVARNGNLCSVTFDGKSVIKAVPIIGDPNNAEKGMSVSIQYIDNKPHAFVSGRSSSLAVGSASSVIVGGGGGSSHPPVTLALGSDPALVLSDQELKLTLPPRVTGVNEGPGIDITGTALSPTVGIGGDTILLFKSNGDPVSEFLPTSAGLASGLAAMLADDTLKLPSVTISGGPWTVSAGTLQGISQFGSILDGRLNVSANCKAECLSVIRSEDSIGFCVGINLIGGARAKNCYVNIYNATGNAYGVYSDTDGICYADNCIVLVESIAGDGYGYFANGAEMYVVGGLVIASTAPVGVG